MNICNFLYNRKLITKHDIKIIDYGLKVILFNSISIFSIILNSLLFFRNISYGIIFLSAFIPIRIISGGYHCKTALRCIISFNSIYILINTILYDIQYNLFILLFLSILLLFIPVYINNQKRHLADRNYTFIKLVILSLILIVNLLKNNRMIFISTICAHLINLILLLAAHIKSFYRNKKKINLFIN